MDFASIDWGKDDSKGDTGLAQYFVPFPNFDAIRAGTKRYVIGRKGVGKTAAIERLRLEGVGDYSFFASDMSLRNFPIQDLREMRNKGARDKSQYVPAWLFLIYVEIARMIAADNAAGPAEVVDELKCFLAANNLDNELGFSHTVTQLKSHKSQLKVAAYWLTGELGRDESSQRLVEIHYQKVVSALEARLRQVVTESTYWIFIDELDEGYRYGDEVARLLILALIRAVEDSVAALSLSNLRYRPLLVLRSDIFDLLEDNDLNKIDESLVHLSWTSDPGDTQFSLRRIVNARIASSVHDGGALKNWNSVVLDNDPDLPAKVDSVWSYVNSRTYGRPRDLLKFLKICGENCQGSVLTFNDVKRAEVAYSAWLYKELRDEIHSYLPCWREALQCITRLGKGIFSKAEFEEELKRDRIVSKWIDKSGGHVDDVIEKFFEFSVLGNVNNSVWLFKYKDHDLAWNPAMSLIVHYGLHKKLRISSRL
ncbi:P-loop ATPase, Sll1717 family [Stenotrophomonas maltophilia]|uniref:P-loop ATPase, Sll1717 family n=1 Tax=Stenotrophomonas maltophilia TaxID=40324 RepID=UPI0015DEA004|nr:hypothetical protein [Stenotrophomonas maltophilia]MDZ5814582.1 hypothetical protein [Stenotrophomonas maltophilia]